MNLLKEQMDNPKIFGFIILVIVLLSSILAVQLQQDSSLDSLISSEGEFNSNEELLKKSFDLGDGLLIIIKEDRKTILSNAARLNDPEVEYYINTLRETLQESQYVKTVSEPIYGDNIIKLNIIVRTPESLGGDRAVKTEINQLLSQVGTPPGITTELTGLPLLIDRISSLLIKDNLTTIALTIIFIFTFLLWYFKSWKFVIAVLISPIISLIMLAAMMVLLDISITISLAAVGVLVLGLGVDYSIHIAIHYKYERQAGKSHRDALIDVMNELKIPITASFLTTLAGFAALLFGVSPSSQDQGAVLSLAIILIYSVSFTAFPVLLTLFVRNEVPKENKTFSKVKKGLAKLAIWQSRHPKTILVAFTIVTVIMFVGMTKVEFNTSNSNWIPDDDPLSLALRQDAFEFGDVNSIFIIVESTQGDLRNEHTAQDVRQLEQLFRAIPNVDSVSSAFTNIGKDRLDILDEITYNPNIRAQFNEDYTLTLIRIQTENTDDTGGKSRVLADIRKTSEDHQIYYAKTSLFGDIVRFEELGESLQADAGRTTLMGIGLVFFIASVIYASIAVGLIALIPIIIGLIWAIGLMGYFGVPFTSLSTGIVSLVLGIGIDFSIHLVDGIKRYMKKFKFEKAVTETLINSGTSILLSSMTTFIGFIALTFSQLLGTQRLGWSLALAVLAVFVVAILTVPAIMRFTEVRK